MSDAYYVPPKAYNEPVLSHAPGSDEREELVKALREAKSSKRHIPMTIGGEKVETDNKIEIRPPHELDRVLGTYSKGNSEHVNAAIDAALAAKVTWQHLPWQERAAVFLRAADLLAGPYRARMNAATMLGQSKTIHQAEIDCVAELADFWRYNVEFMSRIYEEQPENADGIWNRTDYRPLEGFVFAITPFNFTSIGGNLPTAPAIMGNTVVWKAAETQIYADAVIMEILEEAGLPAGVINLLFVDGPTAGDIIFKHPEFAGLHFTGSTGVFRNLWKIIGDNLENYRTYPRIVGETGGKDFLIAHRSADAKSVTTALTRGAFEYQGQKCSAVSRAYLPKSLWPEIKEGLQADLEEIKMGNPEDFENFVGAVIDKAAYEKISGYIARAKEDDGVEILAGGNYSSDEGYFIEPTILRVDDPRYLTMREEIFGPVLTVFIYEDEEYEKTLDLVDSTSPYGLTGAVFARDRVAVKRAAEVLRHAAGNFYINDKPTGAVVGQQPFGGARASGTNDKAGSMLNLYRWISARTIKENFNPPKDYRYPFMESD